MAQRTDPGIDSALWAWADAERRGDTAELAHLLDADFVGIGPRGFQLDKGQWIDRYRSGDLVNATFDITVGVVRRYGEVAIANGLLDQDSRYRGTPNPAVFRFTIVLALVDGWRVTTVQLSGPVPA
jgi:ketosteroid isomerase-like protein